MEGSPQALAPEVARPLEEMMLAARHFAVEVDVFYVSEVGAERWIHWKVFCDA